MGHDDRLEGRLRDSTRRSQHVLDRLVWRELIPRCDNLSCGRSQFEATVAAPGLVTLNSPQSALMDGVTRRVLVAA